MFYRRVGRSQLKLPVISLGLRQNFGFDVASENVQWILRTAFDHGLTHFHLAINYGPPYRAAEIQFGYVLDREFKPYRDQIMISKKAGYDTGPGPYESGESRK